MLGLPPHPVPQAVGMEDRRTAGRRRRAGSSPRRWGALALGVIVLTGVLLALQSGSTGARPGEGARVTEAAPGSPAPSAASESAPAPTPGSSHVAPSAQPTVLKPEDRITGQLFGMSGHLMWRSTAEAVEQLDMLQADGLRVVRFDVSWRSLENVRGQYRYLDKLDAIIDAASARNLDVVITILETPDWANGNRGKWVPPDEPEDYAHFAGMLAARYAGRVLGWEIWNEPDLPIFWVSPDARDYAALLLPASRAIRAADPSTFVVASGPTFGNFDFLRTLYDAGAKGSFDALAVHPYTLRHGPDDRSRPYYSLTNILDGIHRILAARGDPDMQVWITEIGWATAGSTGVTPTQRDRYTARAVELIKERPWITVVTLYAIRKEDNELRGLSTNNVRSSTWKAYIEAVGP